MQNARQESIASAKGADDAGGAEQSACFGRSNIAGIDMYAVESSRIHQFGAVVENQLHFRQRCPQDSSVGKQFGIASGLVAVLRQRNAGLGQLTAQPAQELCAAGGRNRGSIKNGIDLRKEKAMQQE